MEKVRCHEKMNKIEHFLNFSVDFDLATTEIGLFQQKTSKINPFMVNSVLEHRCKRFTKSAKRENFNQKRDPHMKMTQSNKPCNHANTFTNKKKEKKKCIEFHSFLSEQHLSTRFKTCMHTQKIKIF